MEGVSHSLRSDVRDGSKAAIHGRLPRAKMGHLDRLSQAASARERRVPDPSGSLPF